MRQEMKKWTLCVGDSQYACEVPCSYYGVLLQNGLIKDPYWRDQEKLIKAKWGDDCVFKTVFSVEDAFLCKGVQELVFEGIDTLSAIYLNGCLLGKTDNMHRTWRFDVRGRLRAGENTLTVEISSAVTYFREKNRLHPLKGNGDTIPGFAHIRKAYYMSGWDWGPTLPDMGIWRPVYLLGCDARITDVEIRQQHRPDGCVTVCCRSEIEGEGELSTETVIFDEDGRAFPAIRHRDADVVTLTEPKLWWPNGYGAQPLYTVVVKLMRGDIEVDRMTKKIGLRTVTVSQEPDEWGKEFCFLVNGEKIFAMGANYIPEENFLARRSPEKTEALVRRAAEANFNILRVWGGGFYPDDWFYELCDRYGLLVWQDFMFACNMVYLTEELEHTVKAECIDNLKRIRHHASLALLCGNNENEEFLVGYLKSSSMELEKADYLRLFCHILPDLCATYAPDTFYWSSSPSSGTPFFNHADDNVGDRHIWTVWSGLKRIEQYKTYFTRFCSEFGFESLPDLKTVESFTTPADRNLFSPVMEHHQKHKNGNGKLMYYIAQYYDYPTDFERLILATQLMQERAIATAVEHFRRHRGRCMGAIYWQLNDCWPVASWSSIDYCGTPKALYHAAKRFFAPVLLSANETAEGYTLHASNEQREAFVGTLVWRLVDTHLRTVWEKRKGVSVPRLSARELAAIDKAEIPQELANSSVLVFELYSETGELVFSGNTLFVTPKHFRYPAPDLQFTATPAGEGVFTLSVKSSTLARKVKLIFEGIEAEASEQYFDLTDATPRSITVRVSSPDMSAKALLASLRTLSESDLCYANA